MDRPCCVDPVERINQLEAEITSLKRTVTNLQTKNSTWVNFHGILATGLQEVISQGDEPANWPLYRHWSIEVAWTTVRAVWDCSHVEVAGELFIPLLVLIGQGRLHTPDFVAAMSKLTELTSSSPGANVAAIRWLLDACNVRLSSAEDDNGPAKTAVWALADLLMNRWRAPLPNPGNYPVPAILKDAIAINQDFDNEQPRGGYMLRVKVAPENKTASFVKVPRLNWGVLLDLGQKKCAFVDLRLLLPKEEHGTVRVNGPGDKFFELDLDQTDQILFYRKCWD
ncbi:hypothetical protein CcaCcLH18_00840 [Colletotrichum camelliae]|nr:hypothetical protein CcaCcLH18_00840 [Colletotrichum camelliae]